MKFTNLRVHTEYSLFNSVGHISLMVNQAAELKQNALAMTDYGNVSGAFVFNKMCLDKGIKPIIGIDLFISENKKTPFIQEKKIKRIESKVAKFIAENNLRTSQKTKIKQGLKQEISKLKNIKNESSQTFPLTAIAKNIDGLKKIYKVVKDSYDHFYYKPRTDLETLAEFGFQDDIILFCGDVNSFVGSNIANGNLEEVNRFVKKLNDYQLNFFVELSPHSFPFQRETNLALLELSKAARIPLICTNNVHYPLTSDHATLEVLRSSARNISLQVVTQGMHLATTENIFNSFEKNHPELSISVIKNAISNVNEIVDWVDEYKFDKSDKIPKFFDKYYESEYLLKKKTIDGLVSKGLKKRKYFERMEHELEVINFKKFADYFLIVEDMVSWARNKGIGVGLGRGSVGGCLIAYALGITEVDPLQYNLLFERFLDKDRKDWPDIDLDFQSTRRNEIDDYLKSKYGSERVCAIGTHMRLGPSSSIRRVATEMGIDKEEFNDILKENITIHDNFETILQNEEIGPFLKKYPYVHRHVKRIANQIVAFGKHASGVAISCRDLIEDVPIIARNGKENERVTCFIDGKEERVLSSLGIIKIDRLGLDAIDVNQTCLDYIQKNHQQNLNLFSIKTDDQNVFENFKQGNTTTIFQFNEYGMKKLTKQVSPSTIDDLSAINALYRPGPIGAGLLDSFVENKHNPENIEPIHPIVDEILAPTYGVILYQEQVMQLGNRLAGFDSKQANHLRKIIKKSSGSTSTTEERDENRENFLTGCKKNGVSEKIANHIFSSIENFASYSFNKSHSLSYALLAFRQAYLLTYYPTEYFASFLKYQGTQNDKEKKKFTTVVREANNLGIIFLVPDVNTAEIGISIQQSAIMFGLSNIKGLGLIGAQKVIENRPYNSFEEFLEKIPDFRGVTKTSIIKMILIGSFDRIANHTRHGMIMALDDLISNKKRKYKREIEFEDDQELSNQMIDAGLKENFGVGIRSFL